MLLTPERAGPSRVAQVAASIVCLILAAGLVISAPPASGATVRNCIAAGCGDAAGGTQDAYAGAGMISVTVSGNGVQGGQSFATGTKAVSVPSPCWYAPDMTGAEYYAAWQPGGVHSENKKYHGGSFKQWINPHEGHEAHAEDTEGFWYTVSCDYSAGIVESTRDSAEITELRAVMPPVFVPAGVAPPVPDVPVELLRDVATQEMTLPDPGIDWNPKLKGSAATVVGFETWAWLLDPTDAFEVTATAGASSATVTARLSTTTLSAPGAQTTTCTGAGIPWSEGAQSDCVIVFERSSANQPDLTTPLTVSTGWDASWTANGVDQGALDAQTRSATVQVPVAEIQTLIN